MSELRVERYPSLIRLSRRARLRHRLWRLTHRDLAAALDEVDAAAERALFFGPGDTAPCEPDKPWPSWSQ